ncbi:hypothetical protein CMI37_23205 [Candidatus Pacearchaeota archaeon]|nr:hypothetical protein [Candidatus Pacearchaeota archaeon]
MYEDLTERFINMFAFSLVMVNKNYLKNRNKKYMLHLKNLPKKQKYRFKKPSVSDMANLLKLFPNGVIIDVSHSLNK